jgi:mono/diheme cytochrome c family protein
MNMSRVTRTAALGGVVFVIASRPTEVPLSGRELYVRYCASCHGVSGKGDSPELMALRPRLINLTRLRERYV